MVQSRSLNVPERPLPAHLMQEGATLRVLDSHSEVEYTKPPDYLQVPTYLTYTYSWKYKNLEKY